MAVLVLLTGCARAELVQRPGSSMAVANAPVNEAERQGLVRYRLGALPSVQERMRRDAYAKMAASCGGRYRIDWEGPQDTGVVTTLVPGNAYAPPMAYSQAQSMWYIRFSCIQGPEPSAVSAVPSS